MRLSLLATAAILSTTVAARADLLGNSIVATEVLQGTTYNLGTFVDPGTVIGHDGVAIFTIGPSTINLTFGRSVSFLPGTTFTFTDTTAPTDISSITLGPSTVPDLTSSNVTLSPNAFTFDLSGIPANVSQSATFNVNFAAPSSVTPEPSGIALLGTGLLGVAGVIKRRMV